MAVRLSRLLAPLLVLSLAGLLGAYVSTAATSKTTPTCKTGQKSTKAKPCTPKCKTGEKSTKAKPCVEPAPKELTITLPSTIIPTGGGGSSSSSSGTTGATGATGPRGNTGPPGTECPAGQEIPLSANAGDEDEDNESGFFSDGDGCI